MSSSGQQGGFGDEPRWRWRRCCRQGAPEHFATGGRNVSIAAVCEVAFA